MAMKQERGEFLVKTARKIVETYIREGKRPEIKFPEWCEEKRGVFVTLETHPGKELRGCIGFPEPVFPLKEALSQAAISSAAEDPRFPPVRKEELDRIIIEVSVLTVPELITVKSPKEYPGKIKIGEDGLIFRYGFNSGLLLPQVPVEWKWEPEEFLCNTCTKAGCTPDMWLEKNAKIYKFQADVFSEKEPNGKVIKRSLC